MSEIELEKRILELCSEDDYGVWELWWQVETFSSNSAAEREPIFIKTIERLVSTKQLVTKKQTSNGMVDVDFNHEELLRQIHTMPVTRQNIDDFYWFG